MLKAIKVRLYPSDNDLLSDNEIKIIDESK